MKRCYFLLACAFLLLASPSISQAETTIQKTDLKPITTKPAKRPNAPARWFIECTYTNDYLFFSLPEIIESADVTITAGQTIIANATVSNSAPAIQLQAPTPGDYLITAIADSGTTYEGTLTIQ